MSSRNLRNVLKRLEDLEIKEKELIEKSEEECKVVDGLNELQLSVNRKKWFRMLTDVRLRKKCLKKNNGLSDRNEDIAEVTLALLEAEENIQSTEQSLEENGLDCMKPKNEPKTDEYTATNEIDIEDAQFDPHELALERVRPTGNGILFQPPLPHSRPRHEGTSRVPVRRRLSMLESDFTVEEKVDQFVDVEADFVIADQREEDIVSGEVCWAHEDQEGFEEKAKKSQMITSNNHKCLTPRNRKCLLRRNSSLPAHITPSGRSSSLKKSPKSSTVPPDKDCEICNRRPSLVSCSSSVCGLSFKGRLATSCPQHPNNFYLMDHPDICPGCKSTLVEHELEREAAIRVLPLTKRDGELPAGQPGTKVLSKTEREPSDQSGPLLRSVPAVPVGRASFVKKGSGLGESQRERVKRVLKIVTNTK